MRRELAVRHGLLPHQAEARLHLGLIAIAHGDIEHAHTHSATADCACLLRT